MFQELMPLLAQRMLILTLSRVSDEAIRVNVIPKPLKSGQQDDENGLTTPLAVTGTPKELDEQLPRQLMEFVETHLGLSSTLINAKEQIEAAAKAARDAAKKSTNSKNSSISQRTTSTVVEKDGMPDPQLIIDATTEGPRLSDPASLSANVSTGNLFESAEK